MPTVVSVDDIYIKTWGLADKLLVSLQTSNALLVDEGDISEKLCGLSRTLHELQSCTNSILDEIWDLEYEMNRSDILNGNRIHTEGEG